MGKFWSLEFLKICSSLDHFRSSEFLGIFFGRFTKQWDASLGSQGVGINIAHSPAADDQHAHQVIFVFRSFCPPKIWIVSNILEFQTEMICFSMGFPISIPDPPLFSGRWTAASSWSWMPTPSAPLSCRTPRTRRPGWCASWMRRGGGTWRCWCSGRTWMRGFRSCWGGGPPKWCWSEEKKDAGRGGERRFSEWGFHGFPSIQRTIIHSPISHMIWM